MVNVQEVLDNQRRIEESLAARMCEIERSITAASGSESKPSIDKLTQEYRAFRDIVLSTLQLLRAQVQSLTGHIDELDTYNRRNALLFSGVKEKDGEDCAAVILNIINSSMNFPNINSSSMYVSHRLGVRNNTRTRPILVRFEDIKTRNLIWQEKKRLKSTPTVLSEFLTKSRQEVFANARKHFGINRCWTRDGAIMVKLPTNDRKRIITAGELDQLMVKFPSTSHTVGTEKEATTQRPKTGTSSATATIPEPPMTRKRSAAANSKPSK